jgi:hypothetical protein
LPRCVGYEPSLEHQFIDFIEALRKLHRSHVTEAKSRCGNVERSSLSVNAKGYAITTFHTGLQI